MWIFFAILTAVFWGVGYASAEQLLHYIDKKTYLFLSCLIQTPVFYFLSKPDWHQVYHTLKSPAIGYLLVCVLCSIFGCLMSLYAIEQKSASYAAMVEISYPLFTMIATLIMIGRNDFSYNSISGFLMIMGGVWILSK